MTTAADIIKLALLDSGIIGQGQNASAEDTNNALTRLNWLIEQWRRRRWMVYSLTDVAFVSTGALSYTVGTGKNFNIDRPDRLENGCFIRQLNNAGNNLVDYPMQLVQSHEDYSRIRLKTMGTFPAVVFYDSAYPSGNVFFWPVPQASIYELHILAKTPLPSFLTLSTIMNLPPEYEAALSYNLQVRLRAAYRMPADPVMIALAKDAMSVITGANVQIGTLRMPNAVIGGQRGYNIWSDGN